MLLSYYEWEAPKGYAALIGIPFINKILLRTPLILHPKFNKRTNTYQDAPYNPMADFIRGDQEWICYPAKDGSMLIYAYFHNGLLGLYIVDYSYSAQSGIDSDGMAADSWCHGEHLSQGWHKEGPDVYG